jgi:hypothetical protein
MTETHCQTFKKYYIVMGVSLFVMIIILVAAPREVREGDTGCGGDGCFGDDYCCISSSSGVCSIGCFCSSQTSDDWWCQEADPSPSLKPGASAVAFVFLIASILSLCCLLFAVQNHGCGTCTVPEERNPSPLADEDPQEEKKDISKTEGNTEREESSSNDIVSGFSKEIDSGKAEVETKKKEMVVVEGEEMQKGDAEAFNFYTMANSAATMTSTILCGGTDTTIPAESQTTTSTNTITATVTKTSLEEKLGFSLVRSVEGVFFVRRLSPESPFQKTDLVPGVVVKSINGIRIVGEEMDFAMDILKGTVGQVTIVAEKADANGEEMA